MSGHNKWSKIKNKKAVTDAYKSKVFSKMVRLIAVVSKKNGGNINSPELKAVVDKAKSFNVPADNIERAIKKGGEANSANMEAITYEAYGPGGCAIIIDTLTDSRNKTAAEVKHILSKNGYALAGIGSALWAFEKSQTEGWIPKTTMTISPEDAPKLETLVGELEDNDDVQEVYTNAE